MQPLLQQKNNRYYIFWECICSLWYPACNAHMQFRHLCRVQLYNNFLHCVMNSTISIKKKVLNKKCVFWFSLQLLSEKLLILKVAFHHFANAPKKTYVNTHIHLHPNSKTYMYKTVKHGIIKYIFVNCKCI